MTLRGHRTVLAALGLMTATFLLFFSVVFQKMDQQIDEMRGETHVMPTTQPSHPVEAKVDLPTPQPPTAELSAPQPPHKTVMTKHARFVKRARRHPQRHRS